MNKSVNNTTFPKHKDTPPTPHNIPDIVTIMICTKSALVHNHLGASLFKPTDLIWKPATVLNKNINTNTANK